MSEVEIYQAVGGKVKGQFTWRKLLLSEVVHNTDRIVVGGSWKILVDGETVYSYNARLDRRES